ncbi:MAG: carbonic anhydrase [Rikenellaceae bacterium]
MLKEVLEFNKQFVKSGGYKPLITTKYPNKEIAILTCMDARLVKLLSSALGYGNGDVKIIKNAGGIIAHPYGSVIRSLIVAIFKLGVKSVWVIGHTDCGMQHMDVPELLKVMKKRGVCPNEINQIAEQGIDFNNWLGGFHSPEETVLETMNTIINHPLIPNDIAVEGMIIDSTTGELTHLGSRS